MVELAFCSLLAMMLSLPRESGVSRATERLVDAWDWKLARSWSSDFQQEKE
jgi:hypothetical protein